MDTAAWCREYKVDMAESVEQVVSECDNFVIPLYGQSRATQRPMRPATALGKACYVEKDFAPSYAVASELISLAREHSTPCSPRRRCGSSRRYAALWRMWLRASCEGCGDARSGACLKLRGACVEPL